MCLDLYQRSSSTEKALKLLKKSAKNGKVICWKMFKRNGWTGHLVSAIYGSRYHFNKVKKSTRRVQKLSSVEISSSTVNLGIHVYLKESSAKREAKNSYYPPKFVWH